MFPDLIFGKMDVLIAFTSKGKYDRGFSRAQLDVTASETAMMAERRSRAIGSFANE